MPIDRIALGNKIKRYREQFEVSIAELTIATGIPAIKITNFEMGAQEPTGDEVLVLADYFMCDYKFFVSNEKLTPLDQTEALFRRYGNELTSEDRWAIQEVLYFADNEFYLNKVLDYQKTQHFVCHISGENHKNQGKQVAEQLRLFFDYREIEIRLNIYDDFRKIGLLVYRRKLSNSNISGMCIKHPVVGNCIIVNSIEDVYRQRFTAAHEAAHALVDNEDYIVSFVGDRDFREVRANSFAGNYLMPPKLLNKIPNPHNWDESKVILWANKLQVSTTALAYGLKTANLVNQNQVDFIKSIRVPKNLKTDPELPPDLSPKSRERKEALLDRGLSTRYLTMVFAAYTNDLISRARVAEMLRVTEAELVEIASLYQVGVIR
jgi:Zn-dependent peptidase ImmA (M78 family)